MRYIILPILAVWYAYGWISVVRHFDEDWGKGYDKEKDNWRKFFACIHFLLAVIAVIIGVIIVLVKLGGLLIKYW